jgi:hypothetical protein
MSVHGLRQRGTMPAMENRTVVGSGRHSRT